MRNIGNKWLKLCIAIDGKIKLVKLPMAYAFQRPDRQILSSGKETNNTKSLPCGNAYRGLIYYGYVSDIISY